MPKALVTPVESLTVDAESHGENQDWSFANLKRSETLWGPHGYHRYPAKFIPQLVRRVIDDYSMPNALVADPFLGSATTGIEAIRSGRRFWGADINPVAVLISQAKCNPVPPEILSSNWQQLEAKLTDLPTIGKRALTEEEKEVILSIDIARATSDQRFTYWFPAEHTKVLKLILDLITTFPDKTTYGFFLCAFSNILRGSSIWLSGSTKPQKDLNKNLLDPVDAFRRQARGMVRRNTLYWTDLLQSTLEPNDVKNRCTVAHHDARQLPLDNGQLDLIVTSPPYATCYQYLEIHQLTQLWFEKHHILESINLHHKCIGGKGAAVHNCNSHTSGTGSKVADEALRELEKCKVGSVAQTVAQEVRALRHYFQDMQGVLVEFARVVAPDKYLVLVVGDSCKRNVAIPTSDALTEMAIASGFKLEHKIPRKIPVRVLVSKREKKTGRFSSTAQSDTEVYPEEDILVFKRVVKKSRRRRAQGA